MGGGGSQPTQTTTNVMSPEQRRLIEMSMPAFESFAASPPGQYQGQTIADFTAPQVAGQESALRAAGTQGDIASNAANTNMFYTSGNIWDPAVNPQLRGAIDAATRPITAAYQEQVMPTIGDNALAQGGFGGSRQGVAQGIASGKYLTEVGDTASKLVQNQYQTNVDAQLKAMGLAPTVQQTQTTPAATQSLVGAEQQAMAQRKLDAAKSAYDYQAWLPFMTASEIARIATGLPGGSTVSTGNTPGGGGPTGAQVLGGAASGAAIGGAVGGPVGAGVGAAGGAVIPFVWR